jgi:deoxyribodipyrimidine photo-lyase
MAAAIWWLRRDLRLTDNSALDAALSQGGSVVPVFILDPTLWKGTWFNPRRAAFLIENLRSVDRDLRARGSRLIVRSGPPEHELSKLLVESEASKIYAERDHAPFARTRDESVSRRLPLELIGSAAMHPPESILKGDGTPYRVFTPFMRRWKQLPIPDPRQIIPAPEKIPTPGGLSTSKLPQSDGFDLADFPPGEGEAQRRLAAFTDGRHLPVYRYHDLRDRPDLLETSQLSPYLRFGVLSMRQAVVAAQTAILNAGNEIQRQGAETWLNQLIWREFFTGIMYHFPHTRRQAFRAEYREIPWNNDLHDFEAWKTGNTGYPLVDAGMRQLAATGWMHNRVRMVAASFLVKNLLIDWRWGEAWFMQNLLDGDPIVNNGSWQWVAGTGTDAVPYFRIFNPVTQNKKFDPQGDYIRSWIPELLQVPDNYLHTPWKMDAANQLACGVKLGKDYPHPIIDLQFSRQRALAAYKRD